MKDLIGRLTIIGRNLMEELTSVKRYTKELVEECRLRFCPEIEEYCIRDLGTANLQDKFYWGP
jgi:hypothetical protein